MSFLETPRRRLCCVRAVGLSVLGGVLGSAPLYMDVDETGRYLAFAMGGMCFALAAWNLWLMRRVDPDQVVTLPVHAPPAVRRPHYRKLAWLSLVAFPALAVITAMELHELENGEVAEVELLVPLPWIYENFGYWPTVLLIPAVGAICVYALLRFSK